MLLFGRNSTHAYIQGKIHIKILASYKFIKKNYFFYYSTQVKPSNTIEHHSHALPVHDGRATLLELLLGDPRRFERRQRGENRAADPGLYLI